MGGRGLSHRVRVTAEEEERLTVLAEQLGVTVPRLLVESALAQDGTTATERSEIIGELFKLHRLLGNIANNVNQMTKRLHGTGEVAPELRATLVATLRVAKRVDEAAREVRA